MTDFIEDPTNKTNSKIIEFMQDLKSAIENGQFQNNEDQINIEMNNDFENNIQISNLLNVNNLSNQTFSYIINWLRQQQNQQIQIPCVSSYSKHLGFIFLLSPHIIIKYL